ncbi:MAG: YaiO family outer membrane beta-barrel protein, partial [Bacteroidota bacterium]
WKRAHEQYKMVISLVPSHARALDQLRRSRVLMSTNQIGLYGFFEQFSQDERTPHYALTAQYQRQLNRSIRLNGTLGFVRKRFGNLPFEDGFLGTGVTIRLATKSVFSASVNVAPGADVIPRLDFMSEFSQSAMPRTELFLAYRLMDFDKAAVNIVSPGLTYYFPGDAWAMLRVYGAFSEDAARTDAVFGRFTYRFSSVVSGWVGFAEGNEVVRGVSLENLRNLSSRSYLFHIDYFARGELTFLLDYQYVIRRGLFTEHAFGLGVRYRW